MTRKRFLRRNWDKYKRLGRRKKQVWRRPKGIHNKMRERRKGYASRPGIGMKKPKEQKKAVKIIKNLKELTELKKGESVILASVGKKKKLEIAKKAKEMQVKILNLGEEK